MDYQQFAANANIFNNAFLGMPEYSGFVTQPAIASNQAGKDMKSELNDATKMNQDEIKSQNTNVDTMEKMWGSGSTDNMTYQLNTGYPNFEQQLQQYQLQLQQQKSNANMNAQNAVSAAQNIALTNSPWIVANPIQQQLPQDASSLVGLGTNANGTSLIQKQFQLQPQTQQSFSSNSQTSTTNSITQQSIYPGNMMNGNMTSNPYQLSPQSNYFPMPSQIQGIPCVPPYFPIQMLPHGQQQFMPFPPMQLLPYGFPPTSQQFPFFSQLSPQRQALLQQQNIGIPPLQLTKLEPVTQNQQTVTQNPQPVAQKQPPVTPNQPQVTQNQQLKQTNPVSNVVPTPVQQVTKAAPVKIEPASLVTSTSSSSITQNESNSSFSDTQPNSQVIDSTNPSLVESDTKPVKKKGKSAKDQEGSGMPKPALSYSCLISLALKNSKTGHLSVDQIYQFMCDHFPYFNTAPAGWKNSVRHNLSLNKSFQKIEKPSTNGTHHRKGCLWAMTDTKISQLGKEVRKWASKDPAAVTRAMKNPEDLEELKLGNCVKEYQTKSQKHDRQIESVQIVVDTGPQVYGSEISEDSNDVSATNTIEESALEMNANTPQEDHIDVGSNELSASQSTLVAMSAETNPSIQFPSVITCTKTPMLAPTNAATSSVSGAQTIATPHDMTQPALYRTILPTNYVNITPSMIQAIKVGNTKINAQDFVPMQTFGQQSFFTIPRSTN